MERALAVLSFDDPDHLVNPEAMKVSASEARIEVAGAGSQMELRHSAVHHPADRGLEAAWSSIV